MGSVFVVRRSVSVGVAVSAQEEEDEDDPSAVPVLYLVEDADDVLDILYAKIKVVAGRITVSVRLWCLRCGAGAQHRAALVSGWCCVPEGYACLRGGGGGCCTSLTRPKGAYGTTDEAFVLILLVCLSPPDRNSNRLHTGGGHQGEVSAQGFWGGGLGAKP